MHQILITGVIFGVDLVLRLYFCVRVVQRRLPVGVTWGWICLILYFPLIGTLIYLYLGDYRLGRRRTARLAAQSAVIHKLFSGLLADHRAEPGLPLPARSFALGVRGFFFFTTPAWQRP